MTGNPNVTKAAEGFRFGDPGGANPSAAAKKARPWSIRNQVRHLAAQEVDIDDPDAFKFKGKVTRAQRIAMKALQKADAGDMKAIEYATDQIDGKLTQPNLNADFAAIMGKSEEELREFIEQLESATGQGLSPNATAKDSGAETADERTAYGSGAETTAQLAAETLPA